MAKEDFSKTIVNSKRWGIDSGGGQGRSNWGPGPFKRTEGSRNFARFVLYPYYKFEGVEDGNKFMGAQISANQPFGPPRTGERYEFAADIRLKIPSGAVAGFFPYIDKGMGDNGKMTPRDEIDFEFVGKIMNPGSEGNRRAWLVTWNLGHQNNKQVLMPTGWKWDQWHTYRAVWEPNRVSFYVDNILLWTSLSRIPSRGLAVKLNIWVAPEEGAAVDNFPEAHDGALVPTTQRQPPRNKPTYWKQRKNWAQDKRLWHMDVDTLTIRKFERGHEVNLKWYYGFYGDVHY